MDERVGRRARFVAIGLAAAFVAGLLWGTLLEPRLIDVEHHTVAMDGLPPEWEGRSIALFADLQVGMWAANTGTARRVVARLVAEPPTAVLIAGDFLYEYDGDEALAEQIAEVVDIVSPLGRAGIPTYAVLGNHDYSMVEKGDPKNEAMASRLRAALGEAGVRVLQNESVSLHPGGNRASGDSGSGALYLAGVGSNWAGEDDALGAVAQVPPGAPYLLLMHNPRSFEGMRAGTAPVALAAHTHGGQVRLPFTPEWTWLTYFRDDPVHADGWTHGEFGAAGNRLYVNRGIGFSYVPMRFNCPPELTLLTLTGVTR